jgi:hypothetical protein
VGNSSERRRVSDDERGRQIICRLSRRAPNADVWRCCLSSQRRSEKSLGGQRSSNSRTPECTRGCSWSENSGSAKQRTRPLAMSQIQFLKRCAQKIPNIICILHLSIHDSQLVWSHLWS